MKKLKFNLKFLFTLVLGGSLLFTSCSDDDDIVEDDNPVTQGEEDDSDPDSDPDVAVDNGTDEGILDLGESIERDFIGTIVDEAGEPINEVSVSIGSESATTDTNGVFIINGANVLERQAYIISEKEGYLKGLKTTIPTEGTNSVNIMLVSGNVIETIASGVESQVELPSGALVSFDGNFEDEEGNAYSGNVDVIMYHLATSNPNIEDIMPGNLQAQNSDGEENVLDSFGMINVELRSAAGEELNIANGSTATIEIPVDDTQTSVAPATIPLWSFDEESGYWIEDGEAALVNGKYVGQVSHFSWWNYDAKFPTVSLCLNVVNENNMPLAGIRVELSTSSISPRYGYSNSDGQICGLIPANEILTVSILNQCGVEVSVEDIGPFSQDVDYGNLELSSATSSLITGNLVDCSQLNVTNGYVSLGYGNQNTTVKVTDGSFSFSVLQCASEPEFTLEGIDYDAVQKTTEISYNFNNTNVGNLIACNAIEEYISIQIDNEPIEYFLTDIVASFYDDDGVMLDIESSKGEDYISIYGDTSTSIGTFAEGAYTSSGETSFSLSSSFIDSDFTIPDTLEYVLINYGEVGEYIDIAISGEYTDTNGDVKTLNGTVHVLRDEDNLFIFGDPFGNAQ